MKKHRFLDVCAILDVFRDFVTVALALGNTDNAAAQVWSDVFVAGSNGPAVYHTSENVLRLVAKILVRDYAWSTDQAELAADMFRRVVAATGGNVVREITTGEVAGHVDYYGVQDSEDAKVLFAAMAKHQTLVREGRIEGDVELITTDTKFKVRPGLGVTVVPTSTVVDSIKLELVGA